MKKSAYVFARDFQYFLRYFRSSFVWEHNQTFRQSTSGFGFAFQNPHGRKRKKKKKENKDEKSENIRLRFRLLEDGEKVQSWPFSCPPSISSLAENDGWNTVEALLCSTASRFKPSFVLLFYMVSLKL